MSSAFTHHLDRFETKLGELLASISRYAPDEECARELLELHGSLQEIVHNLGQYQEFSREMDETAARSARIDTHIETILRSLGELRGKLNRLPKLEDVASASKELKTISSGVLLSYAMKLAKFTTAPSTIKDPNDRIWPTDNALRRGMLAVYNMSAQAAAPTDALTKPLTKGDGQAEGATGPAAGATGAAAGDGAPGPPPQGATHRRSSFGGSYGGEQSNESEMIEDLDLFDPEDDL